jgi:integration host factor subunit beta
VLSFHKKYHFLGVIMLNIRGFLTAEDIVSKVLLLDQGLTKEDIEGAVDSLFEELALALVCGDRIELRGLGVLSSKKRKSTYARNPRTNERMDVENVYSIHFKPSKDLVRFEEPTANDNGH